MAKLETRFQTFLKKNNRFIRYDIEKISDADVKSAENLTRMMFLATPEDYLLYFASLVLLSAKNKQISGTKKDKHYSFKELVTSAIDASIENNEKFITFCTIKDDSNRQVTYVKLLGCQFSFHEVSESPAMTWARQSGKPQYEEQDWEYTPLQRGANKLFNYALEQENLTRIYMDGSGATPRDIVTKNRKDERQKVAAVIASASVQSEQSSQLTNNQQKANNKIENELGN